MSWKIVITLSLFFLKHDLLLLTEKYIIDKHELNILIKLQLSSSHGLLYIAIQYEPTKHLTKT